MPGGDRTGPLGMGPRTGRAAGFCVGSNVPGYANPVGGRGFFRFGMGAMGRGRGWRHWYHATGLPFWARSTSAAFPGLQAQHPGSVSPEQELEMLKNQADNLKNALDEVNRRIEKHQKQSAGNTKTE
ncbi:MAG TPA: hypothetical protein ENN22_00770 [bacterium]|nr:hypothetical protein [bacterium]